MANSENSGDNIGSHKRRKPLLLLALAFLTSCQLLNPQASAPAPTATTAPSTAQLATATLPPAPSPTAVAPSATSVPPTAQPTSTEPPPPTAEPTQAPPTETATVAPEPTQAPPAENTPELPNPDTAAMTPEAVIGALYDAINRRDFPYAYALWGDNGAASGQTYAEFEAGYATTDSVAIRTKARGIQGAAGTSYGCVSIVLLAKETDGATHSFAGAYLLSRSNVVPGGDPNWRIRRAAIQPLDHIVMPDSEEATALLDTAACPT
jgi:hypothetical protein